jgi:glycine cleavage system transcriptional repressor
MPDDNLLAITVIGNDRPGIAAAVTRDLFEAGCNLEDVTSTILRGHFTMVLVVRSPLDPSEVEKRLSQTSAQFDLVISARPVPETHDIGIPATHMVSVYGSDRPGIVFRVAELLARLGANITDLTSKLMDSGPEPVYALMLEVSLPSDVDLEGALEGLRKELGIDVSVHPIDADVL